MSVTAPADRRLPWDTMSGLSGQDFPSVEAALAATHLDYQVSVWDLYGAPRQEAPLLGTGNLIHAPELRTITRPMPDGSTKILAATGSRFTPIQNADAFAVADDLVADHGSKIVGAADFRSGGSSLLVVDVNRPVTLRLPNGTEDVSDLSLIIRNAHDGSAALTFALTSMRLACTNALRASIAGARASWKVSHTPNSAERVNLAMQSIREVVAYQDAFTVAAQAMVDQAMTDAEFSKIVARIWPIATGKEDSKAGQHAQAMREDVGTLYQSSETLEGARGTLWGGLQALTEWYDWSRPVRSDDADRTRAEGALDGPYARRKANLWDMFLQAV